MVGDRGQRRPDHRFDWLRTQPFWRDVIVIGSDTTPAAHLDRLRQRGVTHFTTRRVDLAAALSRLAEEHNIHRIRVDNGGTLNGALLRAGLVDEVSLLIAPYAVGGRSPRHLFVCDDLADAIAVTAAELLSVQQPQPGTIWLRYRTQSRSH